MDKTVVFPTRKETGQFAGNGAVMIRTHPNVFSDLSGSTLKYRSTQYLDSLLWWGKGDAMYNVSGMTPWDKILYRTDTLPGYTSDIVKKTHSTYDDYQRLFDAIGVSEENRRKVMEGVPPSCWVWRPVEGGVTPFSG